MDGIAKFEKVLLLDNHFMFVIHPWPYWHHQYVILLCPLRRVVVARGWDQACPGFTYPFIFDFAGRTVCWTGLIDFQHFTRVYRHSTNCLLGFNLVLRDIYSKLTILRTLLPPPALPLPWHAERSVRIPLRGNKTCFLLTYPFSRLQGWLLIVSHMIG